VPVNLGEPQKVVLGEPTDCTIWQSVDSTKPCFHSVEKESTSSPSLPKTLSRCDGLSKIETDECITVVATETKMRSFCDVITSPEARKACSERATDSVDRHIVDVSIPPVVSNPTVPKSVPDLNSFAQNELLKQVQKPQVDTSDPRTTAEAFYERMADKAEFRLFQITPYQVKPGDEVTARGMGFQKNGNVLHFGSNTLPAAESVDGMTLMTTIPTSVSEGEYQAYMTNSRGSSLNSNYPVKVIVTNSPKPLPKITKIEPSVVKPTGTINISGENMSGILGIYTSLGWVSGSSSYVSLKSLQFVKNFTDSEYIKSGTILTFNARVQTDAGMSDPFPFQVQF